MNDMKGKQGLVCMGLLLVLSSCHTGKQITASGLQRKDFSKAVCSSLCKYYKALRVCGKMRGDLCRFRYRAGIPM